MKKILIAFLLLVSPLVVIADAENVKIDRLTVLNGSLYIRVDPAPLERPLCATNSNFHYAITLNTTKSHSGEKYFDLLFEMAMNAYNSGSLVTVRSKETCDYISSVEDIGFLILEERL